MPPTCGAERYCVSVPTGWDGPVVLTEDAVECAGDYASELHSGLMDISAAPALCGCACGAVTTAGECRGTVERFALGNVTCTGMPVVAVTLPAPSVCTLATGAFESWRLVEASVLPTCEVLDNTMRPTPTFTERRVCGVSSFA